MSGDQDTVRQVHYWMDRATRAEEAFVNAKYEAEKNEKDAERYRWLCNNNFDRQSVQVHTWYHWWEPHSQTGEPTEWKARVCGGALDQIIDRAMKGEQS
jgi:hypothetical protein